MWGGSQETYHRSSGCIYGGADGHTVALAVCEVKQDRVVICSDLCAVLMSLRSFRLCTRRDLMYDVLQTHGRIRQMGLQIRFPWVPAHVGVEGKEYRGKAGRGGRQEGTEERRLFLQD